MHVDDESTDELTSPWLKRWDELCQRLLAEAQQRGGGGNLFGYVLRLHAPRDGECIKIIVLEAGAAIVELCGRRINVTWELTGGHHNATLEPIVDAIMAGNARLNETDAYVWYEGGSTGRPSDRPSIQPWVSPTDR